MNKLFTFIAFTTILILLPQKNFAQCHINDWTALKAIYNSTNGDNWTNNSGWEMIIANQNSPPQNCVLSDLYGVELLLGRVVSLDLSGNALFGNIPEELDLLEYLVVLKLSNNHICGVIPAALGNLSFLTQLHLNDNSLSGCYSINLSQLCDQLDLFSIFGESNSISSWDDFCNTNISACFPGETYEVSVATDYSGIVDITTTFNELEEFTLINSCVKVMHYPTCYNGNYANCNVVKYFDNHTANEVAWATEKAATFFNNLSTFNVPQLKSYTHCSYDNRVNEAVLNSPESIIYFGRGDSLERYSMTSPDIIGRTFTKYLAQISDDILTNLSNYSESGALKESFADIFGEMIEHACTGQNDWILGSQVIASPIGAAGIRSLSNPSDGNMQYQLPDTYKGVNWKNLDLENDPNSIIEVTQINNGVHNNWFYLLAEGGSGVNDDGVPFTVNGIGKTLATKLAFANFSSLNPNSTYYDAVFNSINIAKTDFADNPQVANEAGNAWKAVGLDVEQVSIANNPIGWRLDNYQINGVSEFTNTEGVTMKPRFMDLVIDSLGQDMSADQLTITMQIPSHFRDVEINHIYPPLTADQLDITYKEDEITVLINRQNSGAAKNSTVAAIPSGSPIFRVGGCIVVIDLGVVNNNNVFRVSNNNQNTMDGSKTEYLFVVEDTDNENKLTLSNRLAHQDCLALGNIETTVLNTVTSSTPPYDFYLFDAADEAIETALSKNEQSHQFFNLMEGTYTLIVEDSSNNNMGFSFNIVFEARKDGSECCPNKLFVPSGDIDGVFNATERIEIKSNTTIRNGSFTICN